MIDKIWLHTRHNATLAKENIQNMDMMNPITKYRPALSSASAKVSESDNGVRKGRSTGVHTFVKARRIVRQIDTT
jgi:hypothetical protein